MARRVGMVAKVRLRQARASDALDLACLIDSASRGLALWFWSTLAAPGQSAIEVGRERIRTLTVSPLHYEGFTVAEVEGAVAGGLTGRLIETPYHRGDAADLPAIFAPLLELEAVAAGSWYLNILAVYPEFRGRGLGRELLGRAEAIARRTPAGRMSIGVEEANARAIRIYRSAGFAELARRPYLPYPGSTDRGDWVLLAKELHRQRPRAIRFAHRPAR